MSEIDDQIESRIIVNPRLRGSRNSATGGTERTTAPDGAAREAPRDESALLSPAPSASYPLGGGRPRNLGDPLGMRLLKQALFPQRAQPVQIGRYSVLRLIGHGGMGAVYACYDEQLDRKVAVKILRVEATRNREVASARLVREGQALARLSHPNVVTVHEVGQTENEVYVAMEFVRGCSLDVWVAEPRPWREILAAFVQASHGLTAAHRVGIVHRDFKPQNVIISEDGLVKVLDFGLARASGEQVQEGWLDSQPDGASESASSSELMRPLTVTGTLVGTPAYMSPEQYRGELVTAASDQFSFCVALYQCLYGVLPFSTRSLAELRNDVLAGRVTPAPVMSQVPARIFKILRRGMSANVADRYPSMAGLLAALEPKRTSLGIRIAVMTAAAALTGVTGFMAASATSPGVEICPDARAELLGIWDDTRVAAIRVAFQAIASPRADEVLAVAEPQVERYAAAWRQMRGEACLTHAEGRQAEGLFALRMACLDQRRSSLRALVQEMATVGPETLDNLAQAAAGLPPLDRCADAPALLAEISPPDDPGLRARIKDHREELARALVLNDVGKSRLGLDLVESLAVDADAMAYEPFAAELELQRGWLQWRANDLDAAERSLERSMLTAVRAGHTAVAGQASSRLAYLRAMVLHQLDRIKLDLPMVEALNSRVTDDVDLHAEYLNNIGSINIQIGDRREGVRLLEAANDLRIKHGRDRTPLALGTLMNLGFLAKDDGRIEDMARIFSEVNALAGELFGPMAPQSTWAATVLVKSTLELGRPREATELGLAALRSAEATQDVEVRRITLRLLAQSELAEGHAVLAREHLEAALPLCAPASVHYDEVLHLLMDAAAAVGDEAAMLAYHQRAVEHLGTASDPIGYRRSMLILHHGLALETLGRPRDALALLEPLQATLPAALVAAEPDIVHRLSLALGRSYRKAGDLDAAEVALLRALTELGQGWPITRADVHHELGLLDLQRHRNDAAARRLLDAESLYAATAESDFTPLARARFALAQALSTSAPARAHERAEAALGAFRATGMTSDARDVGTWLAEHR